VLSTIPLGFDGGLAPAARDDLLGLERTMIDPDDFAGGFAIWSGTSFAAPYVAGVVAQSLAEKLAAGGGHGSPGFADILATVATRERSVWDASNPPFA
jgi:subtilisin family serine protease